MMSTIYTMGGVMSDGVRSFTKVRRMFADQVAVDVDLAADEVAVQAASETRMEKVMRLKAAIEAGRYFVSSEDLAERMMASMLTHGSRKVH